MTGRPTKPCTGCGQPTVCAYYDGDRKVRLCPECLERMRKAPGAREVLPAERGPVLYSLTGVS